MEIDFPPSSVCVFIVISGGLFLAFLFFLFFVFFVPTRIYIQPHRDKKKKKKSSGPTQEPEKAKANGLSIILMAECIDGQSFTNGLP